jgi:hypothetical protein
MPHFMELNVFVSVFVFRTASFVQDDEQCQLFLKLNHSPRSQSLLRVQRRREMATSRKIRIPCVCRVLVNSVIHNPKCCVKARIRGDSVPCCFNIVVSCEISERFHVFMKVSISTETSC